MVVLGCLGLLKKKAKEDEHAVIGYNFLGFWGSDYYKNQHSMIVVKPTRVRKVSGLTTALRGDRIRMGNSCNGLVLLIPYSVTAAPSPRYCVIFNPKSNKMVKRITPPVWFPCVDPIVFFYHPLAKEYRTLNVVTLAHDRHEYHIYLLGSNTWRAALHQTNYNLIYLVRPTCTKQAVYWYSDNILVFDIISEEFCKKPPPVCGELKDLHTPTLVAKGEDSLCCCYVHRAELTIDVWVLEDYANWSWNRKYVVNVNWCKTDRYPSEAWRAYVPDLMGSVRVVSIQKDELVFCFKRDDIRSIFSCHLESGFSVRTKLSMTDWKIYTKDSNSMFCGFIGL